jgi:hypothetical protein
MIGAPLDGMMRKQLWRFLTEHQGNVRFIRITRDTSQTREHRVPPCSQSLPGPSMCRWPGRWEVRVSSPKYLVDPPEVLGFQIFDPVADGLHVFSRLVLCQVDALGLTDDFFGDKDRSLHA